MKGKTDPMERQVIIMYTLTIKQINFSFVLNVRAHKCLCRGGCFTDKFLLSNISDEIHDHMKHERIQQFLLYNYKKIVVPIYDITSVRKPNCNNKFK